MSRHKRTEHTERRIGAVYFSYGSNAWRRSTGVALWKSVEIATDEDVWRLQGRRYAT